MKNLFVPFLAILFACSIPAKAQWIEVNGHTEGYVSALVVSGQSLFEGTSHGVYLFADSGTGWKTVNVGLSNMSVQSLAVSPNGTGGTNLFAGTNGDGVFRSTDNGAIWTAVNTGLTGGAVTALAVSPGGAGGTNLLAAISGSGVFLSTNYGTTWTAIDSGLTSADVRTFAVIPNGTGGTNLFAGSYEGDVFLSTNNGASWKAFTPSLSGSNVSALAMIGASLFKGNQFGVFVSSDNGTSWTPVTSGLPPNPGVSSLVVTPNGTGGSNLFAGARGRGAFLSTNNGSSWIAVDSGLTSTDVRSLAVSPNGAGGANLFAGTYGGGVFLSTNNGATWTATDPNLSSDLAGTYVYAFAVTSHGQSGMSLFAGTLDGVFLSTNNGTSWDAVSSGLTSRGYDALATTPNATGGANLFVGAFGYGQQHLGRGVFLSTNNGASWSAIDSGLTSSWVTSLLISGTNLFAGTSYGVYLSTNYGTSWDTVNSGLPDYFTRYGWITAFAVIPDGAGAPNLFAATNVNGVFRSTNNGKSWNEVNAGLTDTTVWALAASGTNLFAGTATGGVFRSTNYGTSWSAINNGLPKVSFDTAHYAGINTFATSGTNLFAGSHDDGVYLSTNSGTSWTSVRTGLTSTQVGSFFVSGTNLFAGTLGGGVWRRPLSEMVTGVKDIAGRDLPGRFELAQNYPNPFNPSTTIQFSIPRLAYVVLRVFNILGQEVATLVSGDLGTGTYTRQWNAAGLPSGVYFDRLQAGGFTETKKLVLLK